MHPELWGVQVYAITLAVAFLSGSALAAREGQRVGIARWAVLDVAFWCLVLGMVGARAAFVVVEAPTFWAGCFHPQQLGLSAPDCTWALRFWEGGMVFYGSVIGGAAALLLYARRYQIKPLLLLDTAAPTLAVGHILGRIGCIAAGCCWGAPTHSAQWGARFPPGSVAYDDFAAHHTLDRIHDTTPPLHPSQLYEAMGQVGILLFLILWRPRKRAHGDLLGWWLTLYGGLRLLTETTRGDALRGHITRWSWPTLNHLLDLPPAHPTLLSTSQLIALLTSTLGVLILLRRPSPHRPERKFAD
jgi:phosphatidylglycerol---prolipoprotein diacylglyceryl transferase